MQNGQVLKGAYDEGSTTECANHRFALGLITGGALGLGLGMLLAPRSVIAMRANAAASARRLGQQATEGLQQVRSTLGDAVDDATSKAQGVRDELADAVVRTAVRVEHAAAGAKTGH